MLYKCWKPTGKLKELLLDFNYIGSSGIVEMRHAGLILVTILTSNSFKASNDTEKDFFYLSPTHKLLQLRNCCELSLWVSRIKDATLKGITAVQ